MRKTFAFLILFIIISSMLAGCQADHSFIFSDECQAPCWRQITPGKTSFDSTMSIIKNFPDVDTASISTWESWYLFDDVINFNLHSGEHIMIGIIDNVAVLVEISNESGIISFDQGMNLFGNPEFVTQTQINGRAAFNFPPASDAFHKIITAAYPSQGISFDSDLFSDWKPLNSVLSPETEILHISFFDPSFYEDLMKYPFLINKNNSMTPFVEFDWRGYGDASILYPLE